LIVEGRGDPRIQVYPLVSRFRSEDYLLTLILATRAQLVMDAPATLLEADAQPGLRPAKYFDDGIGTSPVFPGDFAPFKPRTDVTLLGSAHVPDGGAARSLTVTFGVGAWRKSLIVVGDSDWVRGAEVTATEPEPFTRMALRLENAFGGIKSPYNPWGKGFGEPAETIGARLPACNIHPMEQRHTLRDVAVQPAGFGPRAEMVLPRAALRGTFDETWLYKRNPLPPLDFKWEFYNAAPEDQQFFPYLLGDEPLTFENLHPDYPVFTSLLPGFRLRVQLRRLGAEIEELTTVLDSVHVDADAMVVDLGWRGVTSTADEKASDISDYDVAMEAVSRQTEDH